MIELLLPSHVSAVDTDKDYTEPRLFPAEKAVIGRAVAKRQAEFTTVRICARAALTRLGLPRTAILPGPCGEPCWPPGAVGSMTHCSGYRAAAVAHARDAASIGIDAEPNSALPDGVLALVARPEESSWLDRHANAWPQVHWDRLLFSVKESVYKAWYPLTGRWLDFHQVSVIVDSSLGTFTADLLVPGPVLDGRERTSFSGRYLICDGLILTAIAVSAAVTN